MVLLQRVLLFVLSLVQLISPAFIKFDTKPTKEPLIIPPAAFFAIWGPITAISFVYGIAQLLPAQLKFALLDELTLPLSVVFACFTLWLLLARARRVWICSAVFLTMLIGNLWAIGQVLESRVTLPPWLLTVVRSMLGVYAGWSTNGVWLNVAAALVQSGVSHTVHGWQAAILVGGTVTSIAGVVYTRAMWSYTLTLVYALTGVALGSWRRGAKGLARLAVVGALLVVATFGAV